MADKYYFYGLAVCIMVYIAWITWVFIKAKIEAGIEEHMCLTEEDHFYVKLTIPDRENADTCVLCGKTKKEG